MLSIVSRTLEQEPEEFLSNLPTQLLKATDMISVSIRWQKAPSVKITCQFLVFWHINCSQRARHHLITLVESIRGQLCIFLRVYSALNSFWGKL